MWRVTAESESPMGHGTDVFLLDADTLAAVRRDVSQGPVTMEVVYGEEGITGAMTMGTQEMSVELKDAPPVFGDENALSPALVALPLAEGYTTTLRTFDLQRQKVRAWKAAVEGRESVTVPAGEFEAFRISLEPLDDLGGSAVIWVSADEPRAVVRSEATLAPQMGGGSVVTELVSRELGTTE